MSRKVPSILFFGIVVCGVFGCASQPIGDSEARGRVNELQASLDKANQRIAELDKQRNTLEEENRRLVAQLAAATGGKGLDVDERQRLLDRRKAELDHLQQQFTVREEAIRQNEIRVERQAREFYEKTNLTMTEIGEAKHIKSEYEQMRRDKDSAIAKAEWWLKFVWGVSIAFGLSILGCCILLYRSVSMHASQRRELAYRQEVAQLLGTTISARLPPEQADAIVSAFDRLAGLDSANSVKQIEN